MFADMSANLKQLRSSRIVTTVREEKNSNDKVALLLRVRSFVSYFFNVANALWICFRKSLSVIMVIFRQKPGIIC